MELEQKIEAILFFKGEPVSVKKLSEILKCDETTVIEGIGNLKEKLQGRGVAILEKDEEFTLGTSPEISEMIESLRKEELNKELSKATLETLSIVLYKNSATRAEIDYIRGVNSSFTLRALAVRGLVEKISDVKDSRRYMYKPSFELLSYMGVRSVDELPDYIEINNSLNTAAKNMEEDISAEEKLETNNEIGN